MKRSHIAGESLALRGGIGHFDAIGVPPLSSCGRRHKLVLEGMNCRLRLVARHFGHRLTSEQLSLMGCFGYQPLSQ